MYNRPIILLLVVFIFATTFLLGCEPTDNKKAEISTQSTDEITEIYEKTIEMETSPQTEISFRESTSVEVDSTTEAIYPSCFEETLTHSETQNSPTNVQATDSSNEDENEFAEDPNLSGSSTRD